jgi:Fe-S-cluster-containing dehydrogenase component
MRKYSLTIDHERCWGCKTCEVACKQENRAAEGVKLVEVQEIGPKVENDHLEFSFFVNVCRQCDDPPCVDACPEEAILQKTDGIVFLNDDLCTGCRLCLDACPYEVIAYNHEKGTAQKCNLCQHRVDHGLLPACADNICLAHCISFSHQGILSRNQGE